MHSGLDPQHPLTEMAPLVSNLPQMKTIIEDLGDDEEKPEGEFSCFVFHITFMVFDVVFRSCKYALIILNH